MRRLAFLAILPFASVALAAAAAPQYVVERKISIPGEGGWDYLIMDSASHRLFISRGTHMQVLDVNSGKIVGDIPNTPGVHGAALVSKAGKGYTSNGRDDTVSVFDLKSLKVLKSVKVGSKPDAILFDPASNRVFTFNAGTQDATAIDVATDAVVGSVKLAGKPEFPVSDGKGNIFVNIEDQSEIQRFDVNRLVVASSWKLAPGEEPSGLAFDAKHHLLFSTCSNNILAVSDAVAGKVVASPKIGNGPDAAAFDSTFGLAFSSNGQDGTLSIVGRSGSSFSVVQTLPTQRGARTMALDSKTHRIYLIAAQYEPAAAGAQNQRPRMVPGSTVIVVAGPAR